MVEYEFRLLAQILEHTPNVRFDGPQWQLRSILDFQVGECLKEGQFTS